MKTEAHVRTVLYRIMTLILLCYAQEVKAQTPWAVTGGHIGFDRVKDIARTVSGDYVACIEGGEPDTCTFMVVKVDPSGHKIWETALGKNAAQEIPISVLIHEEDSLVIVTGYANATKNPWVVALNLISGDLDVTSEIWSDPAPDFSGPTTYAAITGYDSIIVYYHSAGDIILNTVRTLDEPGSVVSYPFPNSIWQDDYMITSSVNYYPGVFVITGSAGPNITPFIWQFYENVPLVYQDLPTDSVFINSIKGYDDAFFNLTGNKFDSSAIYFAVFDTTGGPPNLVFDTLYSTGGIKSVGGDAVWMQDNTWYLTVTEFISADTVQSKLLHIDASGNIIDQSLIVPDEPLMDISSIVNDDDDYPLTVGGLVNHIGVDEEYLIMRSDTIGNLPGCIFNCVWPGDADNTGIVDMSDLLAVGAGYAYTGPTRDSTSIFWIGNSCDVWPDLISPDLNAKYADCRGDGIINADDTTGILANYTFDHPINNYKMGDEGGIPIWLNTAGLVLTPGYHEIPVMLGIELIPVDSIYGLEFTVSYEGPPVIDSEHKIL